MKNERAEAEEIIDRIARKGYRFVHFLIDTGRYRAAYSVREFPIKMRSPIYCLDDNAPEDMQDKEDLVRAMVHALTCGRTITSV